MIFKITRLKKSTKKKTFENFWKYLATMHSVITAVSTTALQNTKEWNI